MINFKFDIYNVKSGHKYSEKALGDRDSSLCMCMYNISLVQ